jgi:Ca2+-binding EF-hand superfamily protein
MKKRTLTALILATTVLSSAAYASCGDKDHSKKGPNKKHGAKKFMMIDANNDGKISKEEMQTFHDNHFMKMDTDKNGFITKEEMKASHKAQHKGKKARLMKMDTNNDGVVSDEEKAAFKKERKDGKECPKKSDDE